MVTRRRRRPTEDPEQVAHVRIGLSVIVSGECEDEDERGGMLALRLDADRARSRGPFDPRRILALDEDEREAWTKQYHAWLHEFFAQDPRVDVDA